MKHPGRAWYTRNNPSDQDVKLGDPMKAIFTKYHGPTNTRGSRISASDSDGNRVTVSYDCALDSESNHRLAATKLCHKMNWHGPLAQGSLKNGYVFVWVWEDGTFNV